MAAARAVARRELWRGAMAGNASSAGCDWPLSSVGDLLEASPANRCWVLEPVIRVANLVSLLGCPAVALFCLHSRFTAEELRRCCARVPHSSRVSPPLKQVSVMRTTRERASKVESFRFWLAQFSLLCGFLAGAVTEASLDGNHYTELVGPSRPLAAIWLAYTLSFFVGTVLFLDRYMELLRAQATGVGSPQGRSGLPATLKRSRRRMAAIAIVIAFDGFTFVLMLAGAPQRAYNTVRFVSLGLLVFVIGVLHAPSVIRPTIAALAMIAQDPLSEPELAARARSTVRRLERLVKATVATGLQVPLICVALLAVPGAHSLAPYIMVNARVMPPSFLLAFQVLHKHTQRRSQPVQRTRDPSAFSA